MRRIVVASLALTALAGAGAAWAWHARPQEVHVAPVVRGEAVELVYATGFVEPQQPVALSSRLTAPVIAVNADEGDRVTAGQVLIFLDAAEQRGLLAQAEAEKRGAELAEQRVSTLYGQGWVTKAARDQAVATASAARAGVTAAAARVGNNVIRSPMSGIVLKREVEPGNMAVPGATLMQLGDPARLRITATVDERDIIAVRPGQEVLLSSDNFPGRTIRAAVQTITPAGDPSQRAFRVRLVLLERIELPFGLTLEVNIVTRRKPAAMLVPAAAVAKNVVWIIGENGRASRRRVAVGIAGTERVEILSGVRPGEQIVLSPPTTLEDGARVKAVR